MPQAKYRYRVFGIVTVRAIFFPPSGIFRNDILSGTEYVSRFIIRVTVQLMKATEPLIYEIHRRLGIQEIDVVELTLLISSHYIRRR